MNASRLNKARGGEQINFMGNLNRCYEQVPGLYFEEKFIFNFKYLTQEKAKVMGIQEQVILFILTGIFLSYKAWRLFGSC